MSTQEIEVNENRKGGFRSVIRKLTNSKFRFIGSVIMLLSFIILSETAVFKYVPGGPSWLIGYGIALLLFLVDSVIRVGSDPKQPVSTMGILGKIKWFLLTPYIFIILFAVLLFILGFQIIGYMAVSSQPNKVKEIITQQMAGLWGGLKLLSLISIAFYGWIMSNYPFPFSKKPGGKETLNYSQDNIHATGISAISFILMLFFTVYFTVEFKTKFVIQ